MVLGLVRNKQVKETSKLFALGKTLYCTALEKLHSEVKMQNKSGNRSTPCSGLTRKMERNKKVRKYKTILISPKSPLHRACPCMNTFCSTVSDVGCISQKLAVLQKQNKTKLNSNSMFSFPFFNDAN